MSRTYIAAVLLGVVSAGLAVVHETLVYGSGVNWPWELTRSSRSTLSAPGSDQAQCVVDRGMLRCR